MAGTTLTKEEWKKQFDTAIKQLVDAQNALTAIQQQIADAQAKLRDLGETPPGGVPSSGGP